MQSFGSCARNLQFASSAHEPKEARVKEWATAGPQVTEVEQESNVVVATNTVVVHGERVEVVAHSKAPEVSTTPHIVFNAGYMSPKNARKMKTIPRKKPNTVKMPIQVEDCCMNSELINNSGLKKKHVDDMLINDLVDESAGLKKYKQDIKHYDGSAVKSIEAKVGEIQPHRAL